MTIIDNIYTNNLSEDSVSGNILLEVADHLTQFAIIQNNVTKKASTVSYKRDFSKFNEKSFLDDLSIQNWEQHTDTDEQYKYFLIKLEGCIDRHAPLKKLNKKEQKLQNKPWITPKIIKKIKHRNEIFSKMKLKPADAHLNTVYKKFRNEINRDLKLSKKNLSEIL